MLYPAAIENTDKLIGIGDGDPGAVGTGVAGVYQGLPVGNPFSNHFLRGTTWSIVTVSGEEEVVGGEGIVGDGAHELVNGRQWNWLTKLL
jgi:hypothetical protein